MCVRVLWMCPVQLSNTAISEACHMPFDEGRLWKGDDAAELKQQLQATFQNITRVMDCVGCEKCKLWGKLQTLGKQDGAHTHCAVHPHTGRLATPLVWKHSNQQQSTLV